MAPLRPVSPPVRAILLGTASEGRLPSPAEETANSFTHGIGLVLSVIGFVPLLTLSVATGSPGHIVGCGVFGLTLVLMYTTSTLYHSFQAPRVKQLFHVLDHIAIYLLIAGTYTPFMLVYLSNGVGWTLLTAVWSLALAGSVFKIFFTGRFVRLSTFVYLAMGWLVVVAAGPVIEALPPGGIGLLFAGGVLYTGGVVFFAWESLPYHHTIWHLFVLGGSLCHYVAVARFVLP